MAKTYKGGYLCGNIRFTITGDAKKPHTCSCNMCQRHSGSITQFWVEFSKEQVQWMDQVVSQGYGGYQITPAEAFALIAGAHSALSMMTL